MRRISINEKDVISQTIASLLNGEVICYPTDTIYGIGTDARTAGPASADGWSVDRSQGHV